MLVRPAEWNFDKIIWLAYPVDEELWQKNLAPAQAEFGALVNALAQEKLVLLFPNDDSSHQFLQSHKISESMEVKVMPHGDVWLRDTLPIFMKNDQGKTCAVIPKFNGWGNKYLFASDVDLADRVANELDVNKIYSDLCFEGGAIESNGEGVIITTEECLLNQNRNPRKTKAEVEAELVAILGAKKVIWLKNGLLNDHTDGHVDTIARFIGPNKIVIMMPKDETDPNAQTLLDIKNHLTQECNLDGGQFDLVYLPSPGAIKNSACEIMPASYVNFVIGKNAVALPAYGVLQDHEAQIILSRHFSQPVVSVPALAILSGGGAFHCMSQDFFI